MWWDLGVMGSRCGGVWVLGVIGGFLGAIQ